MANLNAVYDAGQHTEDTVRYAGPFCTCGDFSCPANDTATARCVNQGYPADPSEFCANDYCSGCGERVSDPHFADCVDAPRLVEFNS